jgi:uncharacterized protein YjiS (DUF1127 family)
MSQSPVLEPRRATAGAWTGRNILSSWACTIKIWLIRQQGRQDLSALDDRMLNDIGISREDALWKVGEPFWRP